MAARAIHDCVMPPDGVRGLPVEAFGVAAYRGTSAEITAHVQAVGVRDETEEVVHAAWREHTDRVWAALDAMDRLAHRLQTRELSYVLCHADLHPGTVITAEDGAIAIIDWDEVMAAPRERDFLFVPPDDAAFWEGYGPLARDPALLAYYHFERAVQDVLASQRVVCQGVRTDPEGRQGEADLLIQTLTERGGQLYAGWRRAAQVPDVSPNAPSSA
jgi:spectinomycin phosphotransferase